MMMRPSVRERYWDLVCRVGCSGACLEAGCNIPQGSAFVDRHHRQLTLVARTRSLADAAYGAEVVRLRRTASSAGRDTRRDHPAAPRPPASRLGPPQPVAAREDLTASAIPPSPSRRSAGRDLSGCLPAPARQRRARAGGISVGVVVMARAGCGLTGAEIVLGPRFTPLPRPACHRPCGRDVRGDRRGMPAPWCWRPCYPRTRAPWARRQPTPRRLHGLGDPARGPAETAQAPPHHAQPATAALHARKPERLDGFPIPTEVASTNQRSASGSEGPFRRARSEWHRWYPP